MTTNTLIPNKTLALYANYNCDTIVNGKKLGGLNAQQEYRSQPQETGSAVQVSVILQTDTSGILYIDYTNIVHEPYEVIELYPLDLTDTTIYKPLPLSNGQNFYTQYIASTVKSPYFRVRFKNISKCKQKVFRITTFLFQTVTEFKTNVTLPPPEPPTPPPQPQKPDSYACILSQDSRCQGMNFRRMKTTYNSDGTANPPQLVSDPAIECGYVPAGTERSRRCDGVNLVVVTSNGTYTNGQLDVTTTTTPNSPQCGYISAGTPCGYVCTYSNNTISVNNTYKQLLNSPYGNDLQTELTNAYNSDTSKGPYKKYLLVATGNYLNSRPTVQINTNSITNDTVCGYQPPPPTFSFNFYISNDKYYIYSEAIPLTSLTATASIRILLNTRTQDGGKTSALSTILNLYVTDAGSPPAFNNFNSWSILKDQSNTEYKIILSASESQQSLSISGAIPGLDGQTYIRILGQYKEQTIETLPATIFSLSQIKISSRTYSSTLTPTSTLSDSG